MSAATDKAQSVFTGAMTALHAIDAIVTASKGLLASTPTTDTILSFLNGIVAVGDTIQKGVTGDLTPDAMQGQLDAFKAALAANNAAIDAAADTKFPPAPAAPSK